MRDLLDASSQRMIKILETLSVHKEWTTFADLSSVVNASERTVAEDISKLRKRWGQNLNINVSKKNGVRMHNSNTASIGLVFTDLFNNSTALRWIKELLFHPNNKLEFYESKLFVSRSTLIRLLPKINSFLAGKGMVIQYRNNRYQFIGDNEQYLRDFSASFLLELYGLDLEKYDLSLDLTVIGNLILSVFSNNLEPREFAWMSEDDISIVYNMVFYLVSLVREEQGYTVISDYPVEEEINAYHLECLQEYFPHITEDNLRPIHQYIFNQHNGWDSDAEKALVVREAEAFFQRLFSNVLVFPDKDTQYVMNFVLRSLYLNVKLRPFETSELFDRVYYFSLSLKRTSLFLYEAVQEGLDIFSKNVKLDLLSRTPDVLFWLCLACPALYQFANPKTALLIDDFGKSHAKFLVKVLSDFFNNKTLVKIDIAAYPDVLTSTEIESYDILITTISDLPVSHNNVIFINDYPSWNNLFEINKALIN